MSYRSRIKTPLNKFVQHIPRLMYSTNEDQPQSCIRDITGEVSYQVIGWWSSAEHIGFLVPITFVNVMALVILCMAMFMAHENAYDFDPVDTRPPIAANAPCRTIPRSGITK